MSTRATEMERLSDQDLRNIAYASTFVSVFMAAGSKSTPEAAIEAAHWEAEFKPAHVDLVEALRDGVPLNRAQLVAALGTLNSTISSLGILRGIRADLDECLPSNPGERAMQDTARRVDRILRDLPRSLA